MDRWLNPVLACSVLAAVKDWSGLKCLHPSWRTFALNCSSHPFTNSPCGPAYTCTSQASWSKEQNKSGKRKHSICRFPFLLALLSISEGKWAKAWCFLMWTRHFDTREGAHQTSSAILNSGKQRSSVLSTPASGKASLDQAGNQMLVFQRFLSSEILQYTEIFVP